MRTSLREQVAIKEAWAKVTINRGWDFVDTTLPWCIAHNSAGAFCSVGFGKLWYFENDEDATLFKLKFG